MMDWDWSTTLHPAQNLTKQPHYPSTITMASPETETDNFFSGMTPSNPPPSFTSFHYPDLNTAPSSSSSWDHQNLDQHQIESHGNLINFHSNFGLPSNYLNSPSESQSYHRLLISSNDLNLNCNIPVSSHSSSLNDNITTTTATSNMTLSSSSSDPNNSLHPITTSSHFTSPSLLHNHHQIQQQRLDHPALCTRPTSFPTNHTSFEYVPDPPSQCVEALHRSSSLSRDISKSPHISYQPDSNQSSESLARYLASSPASQFINLQNGRRPSSGGSVHSDLSALSGQTMGSPDFEGLSLDYHHLGRASNAGSIGSIGSSSSLSNLSYQYEGSDQPAHSSPETFSTGHSRQSSLSSSILPDPLLPPFSLAGLYPNQGMPDTSHAQNQAFEGLCAGGLGGIQPDHLISPELGTRLQVDGRKIESNQITNELDNFRPSLSATSIHRQLKSTIPNTLAAKGQPLNISTNVSTHSMYLHPNDALRHAPHRATPKRQRSRSEGDLLSKLLSHAQSGSFSLRQMLQDDAGVQHMAAIALSPKTPIEFHAENHFQFPPTNSINDRDVDYIPSNLFSSPTSIVENEDPRGTSSPSVPSGPSPVGRRRAVSAARIPPDGLFNLTEGDLTPQGLISNQALPFQHPLQALHFPSCSSIPSSDEPPQIIFSSDLRSSCAAVDHNGVQSTASVPNLGPQFMSPTMNNNMDIDKPTNSSTSDTDFGPPGSTSMNSQFLPFESPAMSFRLLQGDPQIPHQVSTQAAVGLGISSSNTNKFPSPDVHRFSAAESGAANEKFLPFNSRPGSLESTSHRMSDPYLQFCSALDSQVMNEKSQQSHQARTSTGWPSSPTQTFDFGLDQHNVQLMHSSSPGVMDDLNEEGLSSCLLTSPDIHNKSMTSTSQHPYDHASGNIGGRIRRTAPATRKCPECNATFTRNDRLKYHFDAKHAKVPPTCSCPVTGCSKSFRQKSDLSRHIKSVHRELHQAGSMNFQEPPSNRVKRDGT